MPFESSGMKKKASASTSGNTKRPKVVTVVPETTDEDSDLDDFTQSSFHQPNPKYLGRKLQMRFKIKVRGKYKWFNGQILNFDTKTGKYGAFSLQMVRQYLSSS